MRTLHVGLRVSNLDPSLAFYRAVGYTVTGTVEGTPFGNLTMLQLPGDPFVTIELVHNPAKGKVELGTGINHLVIQVESLDAALADLAVKGIAADSPTDPDHGPTADQLDHRPRRLSNRAGGALHEARRAGCPPAGSGWCLDAVVRGASSRPVTSTLPFRHCTGRAGTGRVPAASACRVLAGHLGCGARFPVPCWAWNPASGGGSGHE